MYALTWDRSSQIESCSGLITRDLNMWIWSTINYMWVYFVKIIVLPYSCIVFPRINIIIHITDLHVHIPQRDSPNETTTHRIHTHNTIMSAVDTFGVRNGFYPFFLLGCACTQHMWGYHNSDTQLGCSCRFCCEGTQSGIQASHVLCRVKLRVKVSIKPGSALRLVLEWYLGTTGIWEFPPR